MGACIAGGLTLTTTATYAATGSTASGDQFVTPYSYEQYLPLEKPSDVAITDSYVAISDGNKIYLYDKGNENYYVYEHGDATDPKYLIKKLQFSASGTLYFLDSNTDLYTLHPNAFLTEQTVAATHVERGFSNFAIGSQFYYTLTTTTSSSLSKVNLNEISSQTANTKSGISGTPPLSLFGDYIYYIDGGKHLHQMHIASDWRTAETRTWELIRNDPVSSVAVLGSTAYFTTTDGKDFYAYDLGTGSIINTYENADPEEGYSALSTYGGMVYVVKNQSVCEYDPANGAFTGYEIGTSSSSPNRLQNAKDSVLVDGKLYTADKGRVTVYNTETKEYKTIDGTIDGDRIASDGDSVLLVKNGSHQAYLYDKEGNVTYTLTTDSNDFIVDIVHSHGSFYYVTHYNFYGRIYKNNGTWVKAEVRRAAQGSPSASLIAADIQGNLYVLTTTGSIYSFTDGADGDFLSAQSLSTKTPVHTGGDGEFDNAKKMLVDYAQSIYVQRGNNLIKYLLDGSAYEKQTLPINLSKTIAYSQTTDTPATAVAFGAETADVYVLYDGNLMISTQDLSLPCMSLIATNDVDDSIFDDASVTPEVVKVAKGTLLVEFELERLVDADLFPYVGYVRPAEKQTALVIGRTGGYALLAIYDGTRKQYHTYLAKDNASLEADATGESAPDISEGWLSSGAHLYKFPYLTKLLTVTELPKNQKVQVLGKITVDYEYYRVQYEENGVTKEGYIPTSFVNDFDSTPPQPTQSTAGDGIKDKDAGWRFAYILLGCAVVIILVDFVLLMPRKKED